MARFEEFFEEIEKAGDDEKAIEQAFKNATATSSEEMTENDLAEVVGGKAITLSGVIDMLIGEGGTKFTLISLAVAAKCIYDGIKYGNPYRTYSREYVKSINKEFEKRIPNWMIKLGELGSF